jgi:hypothetical protein
MTARSLRAVQDSAPFGAGIEVVGGAVEREAVDDVLRLLHIDLLERGASAEQLGSWLWGAHWFPHLNYDARVLALAEALPESWRTGTRCDPQILLQFPHVGAEPPITFHLDQEPDWAAGRRYERIVGVALSPWRADNGALLVGSESAPTAIELDAGDAVMMAPDVPHSGGINRTGQIRYGVYFRWLGEPQPKTASSSA